jgi:hypothetical protein
MGELCPLRAALGCQWYFLSPAGLTIPLARTFSALKMIRMDTDNRKSGTGFEVGSKVFKG